MRRLFGKPIGATRLRCRLVVHRCTCKANSGRGEAQGEADAVVSQHTLRIARVQKRGWLRQPACNRLIITHYFSIITESGDRYVMQQPPHSSVAVHVDYLVPIPERWIPTWSHSGGCEHVREQAYAPAPDEGRAADLIGGPLPLFARNGSGSTAEPRSPEGRAAGAQFVAAERA